MQIPKFQPALQAVLQLGMLSVMRCWQPPGQPAQASLMLETVSQCKLFQLPALVMIAVRFACEDTHCPGLTQQSKGSFALGALGLRSFSGADTDQGLQHAEQQWPSDTVARLRPSLQSMLKSSFTTCSSMLLMVQHRRQMLLWSSSSSPYLRMPSAAQRTCLALIQCLQAPC